MADVDYVVVGAGSAGCAVAARLSEDPDVQVLLLEAGGPDRSLNIKIPAAFAKQFKTKLDWDFSTGPEPHLGGRELFVPRGKTLGGSSSMNAMMATRGRPLDFDGWAAAGCEGWGFQDVLPYFKRSESHFGGATDIHGGDGPIHISQLADPRPLTARFLEAAQTVGIPANPDINSPEQDGVSQTPVFHRNGRRWSSADGYLRPAMKRANLDVETHAQALGIELDGHRATGVRWRDRRGRESVASARGEIVVCAGAIGTPQLLMVSGIGPAEHLRSVGVEPVVELAGVGENLQDHPFVVMNWETPLKEDLADAEKPPALVRWIFRRKGPLTSNVGEALAFIRTRPGLPAADLELIFAPAYYHDHGFDEFDGRAFALGPVLLTPRSRGRLRLRSGDPLDKPDIVGNHLAEPEDMASLVAGIRMSREIVKTPPLAEACGRELVPGEDAQSDSELEEAVRREVELLYHPAGTCRMGTDDGAVVDPRLRIRGVDGLRVADASIMPVIVGGHPNAAVLMIAEKAADMIRADAAS